METKEGIGQRLATLIDELGISQTQFGRRLGLSRASVSKWTKDVNLPSETTIRQICQEYGVSYIWLKRGDGNIFVEDGQSDVGMLFDLTQDDTKFIKFYTLLSDDSKHMLKAIAKTYKDMEEKNKPRN